MIQRQAGFSLIEVMLAVSLLGGAGAFLMQQQKSSSRVQSKMSFNQSINSVSMQIQRVLGNRYNCTQTLRGKVIGTEDAPIPLADGIQRASYLPPVDPLIPTIDTYFDLPEDNLVPGDVIFKSAQLIQGHDIMVEKIELLSKGSRDVVRVHFVAGDKRKVEAAGSTKLFRDFPILGKKVDNKYVRCYSETGNIAEESVAQACVSIGAKYDETTRRCELNNFPKCVLAEKNPGGVPRANDCSAVVREAGSKRIVYTADTTVSLAAVKKDRWLCSYKYTPKVGCLKRAVYYSYCWTDNKAVPCTTEEASFCYMRSFAGCVYKPDLQNLEFVKCCRNDPNEPVP